MTSPLPADFTAASRARLELAQELAPGLVRETTLAVAAAGSAAVGCAEADSDLDLLIFDDSLEEGHETEEVVRGVGVAFFHCTRDYPFSLVDEGRADFWILREAARVRSCHVLFERGGFLTRLKERLAGLTLSAGYARAILDRALEQVSLAGTLAGTAPELGLAVLRNALLLTLVPAFHSPRMPEGVYYSKPKWELRAVDALRSPAASELYRRLHGLGALTEAGLAGAAAALGRVKRAVMAMEGLERADDPEAVFRTVDEYLANVESLRRDGQIEAAMAPLQFGLFELGGLVRRTTGAPYEWSLDGLLAMKRLLPAEAYADCLAAARLPADPPPLAAWAEDVRRLNQEIRAYVLA